MTAVLTIKRHFIALFLSLPLVCHATPSPAKTPLAKLPQKMWHRLTQIWTLGRNEAYFTGYAWHNRYTYTVNIRNRYNELAWGGGLGKGFYDEEGDWHGLYAIAFLDSHKNIEPAAGYAFLKVHAINENTHIGAGFTLIVTSRPDIYHYIPFGGILPWAAVRYRQFTLNASYVPGTRHSGNVLFILGKWTF